MKILYVITLPQIGGAQVHLLTLVTELLKREHEAAVVVGAAGWLTEQLEERGIQCVVLPTLRREIAPACDFAALWRLRRIIKEYQPDLVHCHSSKAGLLGRIAARSLGIPAVFTVHGWAFTEGVASTKRRIYECIEWLGGFFAQRIICVSAYDRKLGAAALGKHREKMVTIYNGVSEDAPRYTGIMQDPLHLVMVARFSQPKAQGDVLQALFHLNACGMNIHVDFVGDGAELASARQLAERLSLSGQVRFLGSQTHVEELLPHYDGFLLISRWEGFPISILEAMRAELPVIASDVGGVCEEVLHGTTGLLVRRDNVDDLTEKLQYAAMHREEFRAMGRAGRQSFLENFTTDKMMERIMSVYEEFR